jgi:cell envelope opacity-associated protein A
MTIELPEQLEAALKAQANARGMSPAIYVREVLERDLQKRQEPESCKPFETGRGMWAKYGISLSEEEIDENRADMFRNFGEEF